MNKNILMIAYTCYCSDPRVIREAECLVEDGFEVDFICLQDCCGKKDSIKGVKLYRVNQIKRRANNKYLYILQYFEFFVRALFLSSSLYF